MQLLISLLYLLLYMVLSSCGAIPAPAATSAASAATPSQIAALSNAQLTIVALDIGQGDATLITTPNDHHILIDGGPLGSGKRVTLPYLNTSGITALDHLFATHYDSDHIGGIAEILAGKDGLAGTADDIAVTGHCWDNGESSAKDTPDFLAYRQATADCGHPAQAGDHVQFDDGVHIEVIAAHAKTSAGPLMILDPQDENGASMVLHIRYGNFTYLTTGDLPGGGGAPPFDTADLETPLAPFIGPVDIVHLGHHGSHTSSNLVFLQTLRPSAAIISVGDNNPHYHPHPSVLARLESLDIPVYQTERGHAAGTDASHVAGGNIVIRSGGEGFEIEMPRGGD